jgi:dienelactone hydrolase
MRRAFVVALLLSSPVAHAEDPEALGRTVTQDLAARAFEKVTARFDGTMTKALPAARLAAVWDSVLAQAGAWKAIKSARVETKDVYRMVFVTCAFEKSDLIVKVVLDRDSRIAGLFVVPAVTWSPPAYADATHFEEREVVVGAKYKLPATLTLPKGAGPFAAVVLVHGSGPHDRDETMGPNKLFKDLAGGLATRGVAVLRYDKRTAKYPAEFKADRRYTVEEEVIADARAAVALLGATPAIDAKRIFVVGHSLGGMLAPRIAATDPAVAGLVILAGSTRPIDVLVREQIKITAPGNTEVAANVEQFSKRLNDPKLSPDETIDFLGARIPGAYFIDLRAYDATATAAKLNVPLLILQGQRDYQVTTADFDGWRKALAGRTNATFKLHPDLNHHFVEGRGPSTPAEYAQPGHVAEAVVTDIAAWIGKARR